MTAQQLAAFNKLWLEHWPKCRRQEKKKALRCWEKISPELYSEIYAAVDLQKKQPLLAEGRLCVHPLFVALAPGRALDGQGDGAPAQYRERILSRSRSLD